MKKQILISSLIALGILSGTTVIILNDANATKTNNDNLLAANSTLDTPNIISTSKNETVYILADESGEAKTKFIGNTIYTGTEELPFKLKITYYLNGNEISAKDLAGKSGHIKIVYTYDSLAKYLDKNIPFLGLTGLILDHTSFSNVKLTNGKIITETEDNYVIAGYGIAGLNADLGTDFLPDSFTLEADVNNFKLSDSYTIFTNDILADIDTSKLSDLDGLVSSINQLSDGVNKIVSGATELSNGLGDALNGTKTLYEGSKTLANNTKDALANVNLFSEKLATLSGYNTALNDGASQVFKSILNLTSKSLSSSLGQSVTLTPENYITTLEYLKTVVPAEVVATIETTKSSLQSVESFCSKLKTYSEGVSSAAEKATELYDGFVKLSNGVTTLSNGLGSLVEGETKLYEGSVTLKDGLNTVKTSGIDKLTNFANKDLASFTKNARNTVSAASSYKKFGNTEAETVKFIVKTPSI